MNKIARTISTTVAAAVIATGVGVSTAAPASAAPSASDDRRMVSLLRSSDASARFYNDKSLISAAHYACDRRAFYKIGLQFGNTRKRLNQAIEGEINNNRLGGQRLGLAQSINHYAGDPINFPTFYC